MLPALLPGGPVAAGQGLARPGWAGSGVALDSWWRGAVLYRVDPARFQDSGSSGRGDLPGLAQRLPYLRGLGVDAVVLDGNFEEGALGDLVRAAGQSQMRVLVTVTPALQAGNRGQLLTEVHNWLGDGAAGVYVPAPAAGRNDAGYASLLLALHGLLTSLPGARVLLAAADLPGVAPLRAHPHHGAGTGLFSTGQDGLLTVQAELPVRAPDLAAALRTSLSALTAVRGAADRAPSVSVVTFAQDPPTGSANAAIFATALLASGEDALLDFGDEIGLGTYGGLPAASPTTAAATPPLPVMQWTPANVQQPLPPPVEPPHTPPGLTPFGPYRPYVHPPPAALTGRDPALPTASIDATLPPDLPPPNTLPGFTSGTLPAPPVDGDRVNVATEERSPTSLLNDYRQLISLHHGNPALVSGALLPLNRDAEGCLVWVRRSTAGGQRGTGNVLVAANLSDKTVTLSLDDDLARLSLHGGSLRPLFVASPTALTAEETGALMLPPHAVFIGEVRRP